MTTLGQLGERAVIRRLAKWLPGRADVLAGVGDDAAVVMLPGALQDLLLTTDAVLEGRHFLPDTPGQLVGRKAAARVLSDFAAMGGAPLWLLTDLVAPAQTELARIEEVYDGLGDLARQYEAAVVGGDTTEGPVLELHVFGVGQVPHGRAVLRAGARPGDCIYVTGELGGSRAGRHLTFEPRLREGQWLCEQGWATAMMDLSDGLAIDLPRLLEASHCGAGIDTARLPVAAAIRDDPDAIQRALCDGEDYELLFAVRPEKCDAFEKAWRAVFPLSTHCIGQAHARENDLALWFADGRQEPMTASGYEHFRSGQE